MFKITQLYTYPVKSLAGIPLHTAEITERGFKYDRRWLLIDDQNQFITQRNRGQLALLQTALKAQHLEIRHRNKPTLGELSIPLETTATTRLDVQIWNDVCSAIWVDPAADQWLSAALEQSVRLVYLPNDSARQVDPDWVNFPLNVSFADAYPFLLLGEASLTDLNQRLEQAVGMDRFRPNIVFSGGMPFQEDQWRDLLIGNIEFKGIKPCARCILTTTDQTTGLRHAGGEPLKTLAAYRSQGNKVLFGLNVITTQQGIISLGDELMPL